jgi:hypothetical protein
LEGEFDDLFSRWEFDLMRRSNAASLCLLVCDMAIRQRQRPPLHAQVELGEGHPPATWDQFMQMYSDIEDWSALSDITSRPLPFRKFVKMCFDPAVTSAGYQQLLEVDSFNHL